jgi:hypothetical protein
VLDSLAVSYFACSIAKALGRNCHL